MEAGGGYPVVSYLLQQTLRRLCTESDWVYAVFWRILPRNYPPPKWDTESSVLDRSKGNKRNWILVWEDGFCDFITCARSANESNVSTSSYPSSPDQHPAPEGNQYMQPELFFKMSHEVYSFGEGLMGKVAADNSHKWIYKEPIETDPQFPPAWQGALDPHPRTWEAQFKSGIETIAIVAVKEGLVQLGSLRKTMEDLNFVLFLQRKFNYLQSIPGVYAMHPVLVQPGSASAAAGIIRKTMADHHMVCSGESPSDHQQQQQHQFYHELQLDQRLHDLQQRQQLQKQHEQQHHHHHHPQQQQQQQFWTVDQQLAGLKRSPASSVAPPALVSGDNPVSCLSPSKSFKFDGHHSQQFLLHQAFSSAPPLPSMSSLQALLSRLPSVTSPPPPNSASPAPFLPASPRPPGLPPPPHPPPPPFFPSAPIYVSPKQLPLRSSSSQQPPPASPSAPPPFLHLLPATPPHLYAAQASAAAAAAAQQEQNADCYS